MISFNMVKDKIAKTSIPQHFDPDRPPVIVVYASKWPVSAALIQEHDGTYWPVTFTRRAIKPNEINYGMVEKRGFSSAAHPGYRLRYVGLTRNQGGHASFDAGPAGTIFRPEWEAREMGGVVIELDAINQEL